VQSQSFGTRDVGNVLIQGDNLVALSEIETQMPGQFRCIYLDPPYNNQERYTHYDDSSTHEHWLSEISARLTILARLLRDDGSLWISIDDREMHYLKVAADAIFERKNFISTIVWQQRTTRENRKVFSNNHEYLLVYAKNVEKFKALRNLLPLTNTILARYKNPDNDPRGPWQSVSANAQAGHATKSQFYVLVGPNGKRHAPPNGRCWVYNHEKMRAEIEKNNVWFGAGNNGVPRLKCFLNSARAGLNPETLWLAADVGTTDSAKKHLLDMFPDEPVFDTPKPETLIHRVLQIATNPEDWVLDPYLGSGTTAAVAHKMDRRYVGIATGKHATTLCARRLVNVIRGERGGISSLLNWRGGGGFNFFSLQPEKPISQQ
ncbi:MAG: site-specific DNA-methyltransferase, partial [Candidatus Micrarchaeaceae archaeon]